MRPVAIATLSSDTPLKWRAKVTRVTALRARRARVDIFCRSLGIAADRRVDAPPGLHDAPDERDVFLLDFAIAGTAAPAPGARGRSWRRPSGPTCRDRGGARCPGRSSPPMPLRSLTWCSSALTSVPLACPAPGMDDHPGRLVEDDEVRILDRRCAAAVPPACGVAGRSSGTSTTKRSPAWTAVLARTAPPDAAVTWPSLISRWICERDWSGRSAVRKWSSRRPSCSSSTTSASAGAAGSLIGASRGATGRRRRRGGRLRAGARITSMTMLSGTMSSETNCDVENVADRAARVAAVELDDEARDPVEEHVAPERPARERPSLAFGDEQQTRISSSAPAS